MKKIIFCIAMLLGLSASVQVQARVGEAPISVAIIGGADGPTSIFLAGILGGGSSSEEEDSAEEQDFVEEQGFTEVEDISLDCGDGETVNISAWKTRSFLGHVYELEDGTVLLREAEPEMPEQVYVDGIEGYDGLKPEVQEAIRTYYEERGRLYEISQLLVDAYKDYRYCQEENIEFEPYSITQELSPCAETELELIDRIRPKAIILDHFDNAFPPGSSTVDTRSLKRALAKNYPDLPVVKPKIRKSIWI